jgi:hypothetical protein
LKPVQSANPAVDDPGAQAAVEEAVEAPPAASSPAEGQEAITFHPAAEEASIGKDK